MTQKLRKVSANKNIAQTTRGRESAFAPVISILILAGGMFFFLPRGRVARAARGLPSPASDFSPTLPNSGEPAGGPSPEGMVWIPGGEFSMGAVEMTDMNDVTMQATDDSRPIHRVYVDGFWM